MKDQHKNKSIVDSVLDCPTDKRAADELMKTCDLTDLEAINLIMSLRIAVRKDDRELLQTIIKTLEKRKK